MARRGLMTALQAALAGAGGFGQGVVAQRERERKKVLDDEERERRKMLDAAGLRAEERDIFKMGGTAIARQGEDVAGSVPSSIPLSGVGDAFAAAERAGGPATGRGAFRQSVPGGQSFIIPSMAEQEAVRENSRIAALDAALAGITEKELPTRFRPLIRAGLMTPGQAMAAAQPETPKTPTDPNLLLSRQMSVNSRLAQTYVEAAGGDANKAFQAYQAENPTGKVSRREFDAAATRFSKGMGATAAIDQFLTRLGLPPVE